MAQYQIICTTKEASGYLKDHTHIVAVGTGNSSGYDHYWTVDQVLTLMRAGDVFYTVSASTGKVALVEPFQCARCSRTFIRSQPDAVLDNNLDNLSACRR